MADYLAHINQAKQNLNFLRQVNKNIPESWNWQVTIAYYVAVHCMNAHLAISANLHYGSHERVKKALFDDLSIAKIDEKPYLAYVKLENLSRRSRYLCKDTESKDATVREPEKTFLTHDVHLKKALEKLDTIMQYFNIKYKIDFEIIELNCIELKSTSLKYFSHKGN